MLLQASYLEKCFCCINSPHLTSPMHTVLHIRPQCLTSPIPWTSYLACTQHPFWLASSFFPLLSWRVCLVSVMSQTFFYRHGPTLTDCPMGQVLQFAWPFTQNLMPSMVEPPRINAIPTSGPNKITKACKPPHHVKARCFNMDRAYIKL